MNYSEKPYFDSDGNPIFENSVIVEVDIVGYKNLIEESIKENKQDNVLQDIYYSLEESYKYIKDKSGSKHFFKAFTDNIILGYRFMEPSNGGFELAQALHSIGHFQREMAKRGFFIRGGISVGPIHMSDNLIYGKPLIELKESEKKADKPRIILLESAVDFLKKSEGLSLNNILIEDKDGNEFVNYYYPLYWKTIENFKEVETHKQNIVNKLYEFNEIKKIKEKYEWVVKYHNSYCIEFEYYNNDKFKIKLESASLSKS